MMTVIHDVWLRIERVFQDMQIRQKQELDGYKPGMFSGKKRTGSLDGIRATENEVKKWRQETDGIRRDFTRDVRAEEEQKKQAAKKITGPVGVWDEETICMPVVAKELDVTEKVQVLQPQVDIQTSRPEVLCFEYRDSSTHILELVDEAVQECLEKAGKYPRCIVLSFMRWMTTDTIRAAMDNHFITQDKQARIPYVLSDGTVDCDVMAVCDVDHGK